VSEPAVRRRAYAVAAAAALLVAALGAWMTDLSPWYYELRQPTWKPPDALFGPAWTVIFALAAMSGGTAWMRAPSLAARRHILALFALNGALNVLWSLFFFRLQRPDWALFEVALLWLSLVVMILAFAPFSRQAAWLLVPYLLWVSFAAVLNIAVVQLNRPFA
jgi:tryptophan-rich sensory protein